MNWLGDFLNGKAGACLLVGISCNVEQKKVAWPLVLNCSQWHY